MTSGFGYVNETEKISPPTLQYVWLEAFIPKHCNEFYERYTGHPINADNFICTWSPRKDTCGGDSGGGLIMESGPKKALVLVGILSSGGVCSNKKFPTLFIDVRKEADWIYKTMKRLHYTSDVPFESENERNMHVSDSAALKLSLTALVIVMIIFTL